MVWHKVSEDESQLTTKPGDTAEIDPSSLPSLGTADPLSASASGKTLEVNGQLKLNDSLVLDPSDPPKDPKRGQVYYDKTSNVPMYYDGSKFVAVAAKQDATPVQSVQVVESKPSTAQIEVPIDAAEKNDSNTFTKTNRFLQDVTVEGFTSLQSTSIASLLLGQPLGVASGGTGVSSLTSNGVVIGGGSGALSSVTAGSTGLCLMSSSGAPSFQACPTGGSIPDAVTSTANTAGTLAKFGAGNTIVDSLLSDNGTSVSVGGSLNLGAHNLQLGNSGFGTTLNTTTLTANHTIQLPDASGVICLQASSSCGFVTGTPANFIQNQDTGAQSAANYWVAGVGRADGGLLGPSFDRATVGTLSIGGTNASTINIATNDVAHSINIGTGANTDQDIVIGSVGPGSSLTFNTREYFAVNQGPTTVLQTGLLGEVYLQAGNDSNGALTIRNAAGDNIFRVRETGLYLQRATTVTGNLTPDADNVYDFGAPSLAWRNGYFGTGVYAPSLDTNGAGTLNIGNANASIVNIAAGGGSRTVNIATGAGSQVVVMGETSNSSGLYLQAGSLNLNLTSGGAIHNRYNDQISFGNTLGTNHMTISGTTGEIVVRPEASLRVDGGFRVVNSTAQFDRGITITNVSGLPNYVTPLGASLQTAINIPNYSIGAFGTVLALGMDRLAPDSARAILVADARESAHQPTIGVLNRAESDILGFSWEGQNGIGYIKTLGASVGVVLGNNAVARFHTASIELNQSTQITGGLQVGGAIGGKTDSATALLIQNSSDQELLRADTNAMKLTARALDVTYDLIVGGSITFAGHLRSGGAAPSSAVGPAACTSPTVTVNGTDTSGMVVVSAGSGCVSGGTVMAVTFANAFIEAPKVTLTPANAATATLPAYVDYAQLTRTSFDIATATAMTDGVEYRWYYHAIE